MFARRSAGRGSREAPGGEPGGQGRRRQEGRGQDRQLLRLASGVRTARGFHPAELPCTPAGGPEVLRKSSVHAPEEGNQALQAQPRPLLACQGSQPHAGPRALVGRLPSAQSVRGMGGMPGMCTERAAQAGRRQERIGRYLLSYRISTNLIRM